MGMRIGPKGPKHGPEYCIIYDQTGNLTETFMAKSILIVEDSEDTQELFKATLEQEGFNVAEAKDGATALELLRRRRDFSLIMLDLSLPDMNGMQVLEEMQNERLGEGIPVMLVSAANNMDTLKLPKNVIDTLKKPFFYPELIYKIKQVHGIQADPKPSIPKRDPEPSP
jgi:CheY-like chemotaxis protein